MHVKAVMQVNASITFQVRALMMDQLPAECGAEEPDEPGAHAEAGEKALDAMLQNARDLMTTLERQGEDARAHAQQVLQQWEAHRSTLKRALEECERYESADPPAEVTNLSDQRYAHALAEQARLDEQLQAVGTELKRFVCDAKITAPTVHGS